MDSSQITVLLLIALLLVIVPSVGLYKLFIRAGRPGWLELRRGSIEPQEIERTAGLIGGLEFACDGHRIAAGTSLDLEALLKQFQMLVELAEKLARKPVILERQDEVIGVGRRVADIARG